MHKILLFIVVLCMSIHAQSQEVDVAQCEAASPSVSLPFNITCQNMYDITDETHPTMVQACNAGYIDRFMTDTQREERRKHCGFLVTYLYPFYRAEQIALQREEDPYIRPENSSVVIFDDETTVHREAMIAAVRLLTTASNIKTCNYPATGLNTPRRNAVLRCYNLTSTGETIGHPHRFVIGATLPPNLNKGIPYVLPTGNNEGFVAITESVNNLGTDQTDTEVFLLAGGLYANVARPGADCNADGSCNFSSNSGRVNWCGEANKNWCVLAATGHQYPIGRYLNGVWRFGNNVFTGDNGTSISTMIVATTMAFLKRAYEHTDDLSSKDIVSIVRSCAKDLGDVGPDAENGLGALSYECLYQGFDTPFAPHPKEVIKTEFQHSEFRASTPVSFPQYTSTTILTRSVQYSTSTDVERTEIGRVNGVVLGGVSAVETTTITYSISTRTNVIETETVVSETIRFLGEIEIDRNSQVVVTPTSREFSFSTSTETQVLVNVIPYTVSTEISVEVQTSTSVDVVVEETDRSSQVELGNLSAIETVTILSLVSTTTDVTTTETSVLKTSTFLRTQLLATSTEVVSVDISHVSLLSTATQTQILITTIPYLVSTRASVEVEVSTSVDVVVEETGRSTDIDFGTVSATETTTILSLVSTRTEIISTRISVLETQTRLMEQVLSVSTEVTSIDISHESFLSTATETQVLVNVIPYTVSTEISVEVQTSTSVDVVVEETDRSSQVELGNLSAMETVTILSLVSTRTDVTTTETSVLETSTLLRTQLLATSTEVVSVDISHVSLLSTATQTQILITTIPYLVSTRASVEVEVSTSVDVVVEETGRSTDIDFGTVSATETTTILSLVSTRTEIISTRISVLETQTRLMEQVLSVSTEVTSIDISHESFLSTATETQVLVSIVPYTVSTEISVEVQTSTSVDVVVEETDRSSQVELGNLSAMETVTILSLVSTTTDVTTTETSVLKTSTFLRTQLLATSTEVVSVDISHVSLLSTATQTQILITTIPYLVSTRASVEVEVSTSVETTERAISTQTGIVGKFKVSTITYLVSTVKEVVTTETTVLITEFKLDAVLIRTETEVISVTPTLTTIPVHGMVIRVIRTPRQIIRLRLRVFLEGALQ